MHLTIKERVELVLMSGADGVCYYYLNCFICFGALFMAQNVCYYYLNCFICFGALFMAQNVCYYYLNCFICFGALFMAHPVYQKSRKRTLRKTKGSFFPDAKTQLISNFFKASKPGR